MFGVLINIYSSLSSSFWTNFSSLGEGIEGKQILMGPKQHLGSEILGTQAIWDFKLLKFNKVEETCPHSLNVLEP